MKKTNLFYPLALTVMMTACGKKNDNNTSVQNDKPDTCCVMATYDLQHVLSPTRKYFDCVNKHGEVYSCCFHTIENGEPTNAAYIERGDTIVLQNNQIIKNLTTHKIGFNYVNGRRK